MNKLLELCHKYNISVYIANTPRKEIRFEFTRFTNQRLAIIKSIDDILAMNPDIEDYLYFMVVKVFKLEEESSSLAPASGVMKMWPNKCLRCDGQGVTYGLGGMHICECCRGTGRFISNEKED